ncbi:MAG: DUF2075 domain-containing protein [Betaproteobacteria bacterium]|nr:DUF2075 domain-containing protein [Betaproteobacteria bacterium]
MVTSNAYYSADVSAFVATASETILGAISTNTDFAMEVTQRDAWRDQIEILKPALKGVKGHIFLEFVVPRIGSRIDAVLIIGPIIFVIEFKVGETEIKRQDINQVWDYALDLKNFHLESHEAPIVPILVATHATKYDTALTIPHADKVFPPLRCNSKGIRQLIDTALVEISGKELGAREWSSSSYQPTPTIIEAAQALFARHSVDAIARHDAGARNLRITSKRVEELAEQARRDHCKMIIFVTGVPGAGKTLVGLNVATKKRDQTQPAHAVFLSGNGPLVAVLREALTRDEVARLRKRLNKTRKGEVAQKVKAFIQNVHHFRDDGLRDDTPPSDHVVIFDEAQRAWNREKTTDFMRRKRGQAEFNQSEPEFLISYMDRHKWAVVICLVGGGQEIHSGEAGISAWLDAINEGFPSWQVYVSPNLTDSEYTAGHALESLNGRANVVKDESLHLAVSMRSFRAENVASFVKAALDCEGEKARENLAKMSSRYPIALTRDLETAKQWIRDHARGSERFGLVASSGARRLKPHAIDVRVETNPIHWFLNDANDVRSSYYMEDAATEFQIQGLELDWVCMTWDADFRFSKSGWGYHSFEGAKWKLVRKLERQQYLRNAYRVLLTRARQGMVIYVPKGDERDWTRPPAYYDSTFNYLSSIGIPVLPS